MDGILLVDSLIRWYQNTYFTLHLHRDSDLSGYFHSIKIEYATCSRPPRTAPPWLFILDYCHSSYVRVVMSILLFGPLPFDRALLCVESSSGWHLLAADKSTDLFQATVAVCIMYVRGRSTRSSASILHESNAKKRTDPGQENTYMYTK